MLILGEEGQRKLRLRNLTNDSLFELWDGELAVRYRTPKTLYEGRRLFRHFKDFLGPYPPSPELGKQFLGKFTERRPGTFYRYWALLKVFFQWYGSPLGMKVRMPKQLPPYVEDKDIDAVIKAMQSKPTHKKTIARDVLIVELARSTGLRREELANLEIKDIHLDQGVLVVREGKGSKDASIPLTQEISTQLRAYLEGNGLSPDSKLFGGLKPSTISDKIRKFAQKAGVDIHCHSLRHAFATRLIERGANPEAVRQLMRHESLAVTQKYISLGGKGLREAVSLLDNHQSQPKTKTGQPLTPQQLPADQRWRHSWELPENLSPTERERQKVGKK